MEATQERIMKFMTEEQFMNFMLHIQGSDETKAKKTWNDMVQDEVTQQDCSIPNKDNAKQSGRIRRGRRPLPKEYSKGMHCTSLLYPFINFA